MIPIILLFLKIVLSTAQAGNDVQQSNGLQEGQICLFTCSEWIFEDKIQQFAPSANLFGAGYLSNHKIGLSSNNGKSQRGLDSSVHYKRIWGAVYLIDESERDNVLEQSQIEYSIPFTSYEDVFMVEHEDMNCLVVDLGIQPGDHPPWRNFQMKVPNTFQDDEYFNRLAQIGVPQEYIEGLQNVSAKPQYHPTIPQDYHPKQIDNVPKPTNGEIPTNAPLSVQIPETHDGEPMPKKLLPGVPNPRNQPRTTILPDTVQAVPATLSQPSEPKKLLPGVITPGSKPSTATYAPRPLDSLTTPSQPSRQKKILLGVATPRSQPQDMTEKPCPVKENELPYTVEPEPDDFAVTVPKHIDTDNQPTVVIHPMKLRESSDEPVATELIDNSPYHPHVLVPKKYNSDSSISSRNVIKTTQQHEAIDSTVSTKVTDVTYTPTINEVNPKVPEATQTPVEDESYVVISPLKLPQSQADLNSSAAGEDYVEETPFSLQSDDTAPQTIRKNVPPILFSEPKQSINVEPDHTIITQPLVIQQPSTLLPSEITAPPRLPLQPHLLINPSTQPGTEPVPELLPTSYEIPRDHDVPGENSGLLTLSPSPDMTPTYQNNSPLLTLNGDTSQLDHSTDETTQFTPNTPDISPPSSYSGYAIPPSYGVSKPAPILSDKPMFGFPRSNQHVVNSIPTTSPDISKFTPLRSNQSNSNHIVGAFPTTYDVPKPVSTLSDEPMFVQDLPKPNLIPQQKIPYNVDSGNSPNPDLLLTNTAPSPLQLYPYGEQPVYSIPPSFGTTKPMFILQDKPMFNLDNYPSTTIPTTYGVASSPPVPVKDEPMFTLDDSPLLQQPKQIYEDNNKTPIPVNDDQVNNVPLTRMNAPPSRTISQTPPAPYQVLLPTTTPDFQTIQQPNSVVDSSKQVTVNSQSNTATLASTTSSSSTIIQQSPNSEVDSPKHVTLASHPYSEPVTTTQPTEDTVPNHSITSQSTSNANLVQAARVEAQHVQQAHAPSIYTPSNLMAPHYTPGSSDLGYSFGHRYPEYLSNCNYKPPNRYYDPYELIPGFTFGSHIQLYDRQ